MSDDHGGHVIIRKKKSDGEEEHHGGVWKLAFADFMTAMMAFFLVMWLINSTSKETKASIVQYFNPVQLIDANPAHKGLHDPKEKGRGQSIDQADAQNVVESQERQKEEALHKEPMKALEQIAQRDPPPQPSHDRAPPAASAETRDPFDRDEGEAASRNFESQSRAAGLSRDNAATATKLAAEIARMTARESHAPKVEVRQTEEGVLISLTDDANFSMFAVGSIEPKPQLVRLLAQIGKALASRSGEIELRGHTDARVYASKSYDNWRLSSDRATMVNYMLLRGGLPSTRIGKIVGFADRRPKNSKDPFAAVNRRIEILLHGDGG